MYVKELRQLKTMVSLRALYELFWPIKFDSTSPHVAFQDLSLTHSPQALASVSASKRQKFILVFSGCLLRWKKGDANGDGDRKHTTVVSIVLFNKNI